VSVESFPVRLAARAAGIRGSPIDSSTSLLQAQTHSVISLAMGSPAPDAIPAAVFAEHMAEPWDAAAFAYGPTEGEWTLRHALLEFLGSQGEALPAPEELLVTSGGMQGLDLCCKLFVDAGDLVVVESPTYTNGICTILGYGGRVLEAPLDDDGLVVEDLPRLVGDEVPRMIYVIPTFQNPSGTTLSLERRHALVDLAAEWGSVILEDDPYRLLGFGGERLPSIQSIAAGRAHVVSVHTTSKIMAPGLRVGWVTAAAPLIGRMVDAKQAMDTCTNVPMQLLVERFLTSGAAASHIDRVRTLYGERKDAMRRSLAAHFGDLGATWTDPAGGFFLWLTLPERVDTEALFSVALEEGVAFIPGPAFSASGSFTNALRLCFASNDASVIDEGVALLRRALDRLEIRAPAEARL
jgi:2-aminoadipate transaminase